MKIGLDTIDKTQFMVHSHIINGEEVYLVQPQHAGCSWTQENKFLRSSVWDSEGNLISAGFPKFTNWGENMENFPVPNSLQNTQIIEKLDGSLLIVSKWKGTFILRTRGTVDAFKLDNGHELTQFKQKYLHKLSSLNPSDTWEGSYLFEWTSPYQRIILNYGDSPEWYLIGHVNHKDYSLMDQDSLNQWAKSIECPRPLNYIFPTIRELIETIDEWKGKEGVVIYSKSGQVMHKVKTFWYLTLHRMKEALSSFDKVIDVWFEQDQPSYSEFEKFIVSQFDWELWQQIRGDASKICDASKGVDQIVAGMQRFVDEKLKVLPTRKEQAQLIISSYGQTNRASFVFKLLDGKELTPTDRKKLLYQVLKIS